MINVVPFWGRPDILSQSWSVYRFSNAWHCSPPEILAREELLWIRCKITSVSQLCIKTPWQSPCASSRRHWNFKGGVEGTLWPLWYLRHWCDHAVFISNNILCSTNCLLLRINLVFQAQDLALAILFFQSQVYQLLWKTVEARWFFAFVKIAQTSKQAAKLWEKAGTHQIVESCSCEHYNAIGALFHSSWMCGFRVSHFLSTVKHSEHSLSVFETVDIVCQIITQMSSPKGDFE